MPEQDTLGMPRPASRPLWSIVLAGGDGTRLRPLIRELFGDERPKQYARLQGSRSMLRATLDRSARLTPSERTIVVTAQHHHRYVEAELGAGAVPHRVVQPSNRGTAAGILLPVHRVRRESPDAIVAVFPSDHFVLDEDVFARHVTAVADSVRERPDRIVLVGARAEGPETGYGWIEPAGSLTDGDAIRPVRRFWEKPSADVARSCFERGHLWNTFVMVGAAAAFVDAGRRLLPDLNTRLERAAARLGGAHEEGALESVYEGAPSVDFSRTVLQALGSSLGVSRLPAVGWSDWGTPDRVIRSLRAARLTPPWLGRFPLSA